MNARLVLFASVLCLSTPGCLTAALWSSEANRVPPLQASSLRPRQEVQPVGFTSAALRGDQLELTVAFADGSALRAEYRLEAERRSPVGPRWTSSRPSEEALKASEAVSIAQIGSHTAGQSVGQVRLVSAPNPWGERVAVVSIQNRLAQEVALPYQNGERSFGQSFLLRASLTPFAFAADLAAWPLEALAYGAWALLTP